MAQVLVEPTTANRKKGTRPLAMSSWRPARRASGSIAHSLAAVAGSRRQWLIPATMQAFFNELCACK